MVNMDSGDLLAEMNIFLQVTLDQEKLSDYAETCRKKLIARLQDGFPPQAYIDMNGSSFCQQKLQHQNSDCYEEFSNSFKTNYKDQQHIPEAYVNNLYNKFSSMCEENIYANNDLDSKNYINIKLPSQCEDNTYNNPSSPLANTPVIPTKLSTLDKNTQSNSERNSIISYKKDSPDRISVSSSFTSSSTRCDESPEVLAMSASALRYAAIKSGILGRREKFLFLDHTKTYWVAVVSQTLFMFTTDKDCKPVFELDITDYKARPVVIPNSNKTDYKFELVAPGKKTHQFITEKQSDMEKWISAINSATKAVESPKEWFRQLPSPPTQGLEAYDLPDGAVRPLLEAEYDLPDVLHQLSCSPIQREERRFSNQLISSEKYNNNKSNSCQRQIMGKNASSPKEIRRLPLLPHQQETYDQPESVIRPVVEAQQELYECLPEELYHSIEDQPKEVLRRLPSLPHDVYDKPEPTIRPVVKQEIVQEEFYSVIDNIPTEKPDHQEAVYKNVQEDSFTNVEDSSYYNLIPYPERETEQECIYDVIIEQRHMNSLSPSIKLSSNNSKKPVIAIKPPVNSTNNGIKIKLEETKLSPSKRNVATISNKPFTKPQIRDIKPPIVK